MKELLTIASLIMLPCLLWAMWIILTTFGLPALLGLGVGALFVAAKCL